MVSRTILTFKEKHEAIKEIKEGVSKEIIMKKYKISIRTFYNLSKASVEQNLEVMKKENGLFYNKRKLVRKCKNDYLDKALIRWFCETRDRGEPISGPILKEKALVFNESLNGSTSFKASDGWLGKFKERYNIRMTGEKLSDDYEGAEAFTKFLIEKIKTENFSLHNIYNADESGIYWKTLQTSTLPINREGVSGWKQCKDRTTALFCCNAAGSHRIPLLIVGKSKTPRSLASLITPELKKERLKDFSMLGVTYTDQKNGWMDRDIFMLWYKNEFIPRVLEDQKKTGRTGKVLLLLDNAPSHPTLDELNSLNEHFEVVYLPPNVAAIIQPMNQGLIATTKKLYKKFLLRNMLIHKETTPLDVFSEELDLKDCFTLLSGAWNCIKESSLQEAWKSLLGDELFMDFEEVSIKIEFNVHDNANELKYSDDSTNFPDLLADEITEKLSNSDFSPREIKKSLVSWFEDVEEDCGWEASTDDDIVHIVMNGKKNPEILDVDDVEMFENTDPLEIVTSAEANDCLLKFRIWMQQQSNAKDYFPHLDALQNFINKNLSNS